LFSSTAENWEENGGENGDDSYDHQQFNQCETSIFISHHHIENRLLSFYLSPIFVSGLSGEGEGGQELLPPF
jgi:hypothetical protein